MLILRDFVNFEFPLQYIISSLFEKQMMTDFLTVFSNKKNETLYSVEYLYRNCLKKYF